MADYTDEESLENPTNNQSENPPDEITPTAEAEIINPNQETKNMEVHHHTHNSAEPHHKKNWKLYLWEFFMLFTAVFCGFLAEIQVEHYVEHQREKKLVASLFEDLKKDTISIADVKQWEEYRKVMDSLGVEIKRPTDKRNYKSLYKWFSAMRGFNAFEYHNRTIEQLKNGGNFRLITSKTLSDSLIDYDTYIISRLRDQEEQSKVVYQKLNFLQDKFINSEYYDLVWDNNLKFDSVYNASPTTFIISDSNSDYLFEYYNHLQFFKTMTDFRIHTMKNMQRMSDNLLKQISKTYNIK